MFEEIIVSLFPAIVIFVLTGLFIKGMKDRDKAIIKLEKLCNQLTPVNIYRLNLLVGAVDAYFASGCSDIYLKELEKAYNGGKDA